MRRLVRRVIGPAGYDELRIAAAVLPRRDGIMVDVGAHHGSSCAHFVGRGWTVHAFEPDPENRAELELRFGGHPGVHIDPRAVTETSGQQLTLYTSDVSTGISGLSAFHTSHVPTTTVTTVALRDHLAASPPAGGVDLLKIDTEGHELFVLRGLDWDRHRPSVVVAEFEDRKTVPLGYDHADLAEFLVGHGYAVLVSEWEPVVEYGRRHTWRRLVRWPADVVDDAWGNLVAIPPQRRRAAALAGRMIAAQLRVRLTVESLRSAIGVE